MESACTGTPRTARFRPAMSGVRGRHDVCTRAGQGLRQRQLFARMIEATRGQVSQQQLLDGASQVAASTAQPGMNSGSAQTRCAIQRSSADRARGPQLHRAERPTKRSRRQRPAAAGVRPRRFRANSTAMTRATRAAAASPVVFA